MQPPMPGPARFAAFLVVRFALAALLAAVARPVFADNERVIAVPAIRALAPEVSDDAARVTAEIRQRLKALPLLRIVDGPPVLSTYEDRVPQFEARLQEHVDLVLIGIASLLADGRHTMLLRVWKADGRTQLVGQQYVSGANQLVEAEIADGLCGALAAALQQERAPAPR
ncbi:hypothetical protein JQ619_16200 [Bradyrhizobium denitrificans]|jgi:hypothetical protein|uniref:Uncharacterized protein n=2 Tax=Nitrobacteraceae TaxID=41294 RepID=A0ABS5G7P6_9BRAD|nr:hypothetical protein [Bradyrhizobium denitrificans]NPU20826.1 hypothetical protein [Bradyrhizobium sp. LMG 8443]